MLITEMSQKECREFLTRATMGRLGCVRGNFPYVVPIYFAYEADQMYGFTSLGRKIEWMRTNPNVCVEVDEVVNPSHWKSAIVTGRYEELTDSTSYRWEREQARTLLEKRFLWLQTAYAALRHRGTGWQDPAIFYCIHIESMTGHIATPDLSEVREFADEAAAPCLALEPAAAGAATAAL